MEEEYIKKIITVILLGILFLLAYYLLKPILLSIVIGLFLAFLVNPLYKFGLKHLKSKDLTAILVCVILFLVLAIFGWFSIPIIFEQTFKVYNSFQQLDLVSAINSLFPSLFSSTAIPIILSSAIDSFVSKSINSFANSISIDSIITWAFQFLVVLFTFYFVLRDQEDLVNYIKSILPFSKEVEKKIFENTYGLTASIIYGQIFVGLIQGIIVSLGLFLFGVPNALLLTLVACIAAIIPIFGPVIVWVPVTIYLFAAGNPFAALGMAIFGLISSVIDNILKPIIVSKRTSIHSSVILIGMVGGFFLFGMLGLILGPLVLAYLLVILEIYRNKKIPGAIIPASE